MLFWEQSLPDVKVLSEDLSIKVNLKEGTLKFFNQAKELVEYSAVQFHLHAPAEHTINGERHDAEFHIVHKI